MSVKPDMYISFTVCGALKDILKTERIVTHKDLLFLVLRKGNCLPTHSFSFQEVKKYTVFSSYLMCQLGQDGPVPSKRVFYW
jgi:hypothetical protein